MTRIQATIPEPYEDVKSLRASVMALKELVEVLAGQRGRDDQAVTWGELPPSAPVGDGRWNPLPYANGWVDYVDPGYGSCGFRKLSSGLVLMRGLTAHGTAPPPAGICTLPAGYRPSITMLYIAHHGGGMCRVDVTPSGVVSHSGGSNAWLSLNNISFLAEN